jgi:uncharacterized protein YciI
MQDNIRFRHDIALQLANAIHTQGERMFIVLLNYIKPMSEVERLAPEHRAYAARQYANGNFLLSGRKEPRTGGIILARAPSRAALDVILDEDPFRREAAATYEVIEFLPMMSADWLTGLLPPV